MYMLKIKVLLIINPINYQEITQIKGIDTDEIKAVKLFSF